jgi:predicted phage baseplate assembly protein
MNTTTCGCCTGTEILTPQPTANRPGLDALAGRIGTHATFIESMKARLASAEFPELRALTTRDASDPAIALLDAWATVADVLGFYQERLANEGYLRTATERRSVLELARLIGYAPRPGVAASAHLAYTIEADRSVTPPASIKATIPAGSRAQSIPGPGELPQTFETSEPLEARTEWNNLGLRLTQPQTVASILSPSTPRLFLTGTSTNLKPNDIALIDFGNGNIPVRIVEVNADSVASRTEVRLKLWMNEKEAAAFIAEIASRFQKTKDFGVPDTNEAVKGSLTELKSLQAAAEKPERSETLADFLGTRLLPGLVAARQIIAGDENGRIEAWISAAILELAVAHEILAAVSEEVNGSRAAIGAIPTAPNAVRKPAFIEALNLAASIPPTGAANLRRNADSTLSARADLLPRFLAATQPSLAAGLYPALRNAAVTPQQAIKFRALRVKASLFAHNTPPQPQFSDNELSGFASPSISNTWEGLVDGINSLPTIALDAPYEQILPESFALIDRPNVSKEGGRTRSLHRVREVQPITMAALGASTKVTQLTLERPWLDAISEAQRRPLLSSTPFLRGTIVYAQSEELELAEQPVTSSIGHCDKNPQPETTVIELDRMYDGLDPGRWLIVAGERAIEGTSGVRAAELVMLAGVEHRFNPELPGDTLHTFLALSTSLAYCYRRDTVTIYGNVVKATHGETRREVLGSGDSAQAMQTFELKQPPLTFVSAPDPSGIRSTLRVRVNEGEWHETDSLAGLGPKERNFIVRIDDDGKTKIVFGNGVSGARPPTGQANLRADYRNGIGKGGNVRAGQIALLASRPLGVKEVVNPLRASGGADRETRDQARRNAPLAVQALDRLVSVRDYADFARTFAGIGKASAGHVPDARQQFVHLTIAGADDIPIEKHSDLFVNLRRALRDFGDPFLPVKIDVRELLALFIAARVRVLPDYEWESVEPRVRAALLNTFSFERRELGQGVTPGEVIAAIQRVRGVEYVDLDALRGLEQAQVEAVFAATLDPAQKAATLAEAGDKPECVNAQLARLDDTKTRVLPAQLAFLSPAVPDTLLLTEITA